MEVVMRVDLRELDVVSRVAPEFTADLLEVS